jgi:hypothetical protein
MDLILHFGVHKTGSSSIQDTLYALDDDSFNYIHFGRPNPSLQIVKGYSANWHRRKKFARHNPTEKDIHRGTTKSQEALVKAIQSAPSKKTILSSEAIAHLKPDEIQKLISDIRPYTKSIRAIGYLRPLKSYAESVFQERLKRAPLSLDEFTVPVKYRQLIEGLDDTLGHENVSVYKFDRSEFEQGCVVRDFCQHVEIELKSDDVISSNMSLSLQAVKLIYLLWKYHPEFYRVYENRVAALLAKVFPSKIKPNVNRKMIVNAVEKLSHLKGEKMFFHSDACQKIIEVDQGELAWIQNRTGINLEENIHAHDQSGIRDEAQLLNIEEDSIVWLLKHLSQPTDNVERLKNAPKQLAELLYQFVRQ